MPPTSNETVRRVKRTLTQAIAGGVFTAAMIALATGNWKTAGTALAGALSTVFASYAQNSMEDGSALRDRR